MAGLAAEDAHVVEPLRGRRTHVERDDQRFSGTDGKVEKVHCVQVDEKFKPIPGTEFELKADLVLAGDGLLASGA